MLTAEQTGSKAWSPKNDGNRYEPMLTLRQGLMRSKNMVSIRILQAIGPQYAQDYLTRFGFDKARWPAVPLALGAGGATPLQVVNGYSVFANGGYRVTPFLIDRVTDRSGHVLMQAQPVVAGDAAARAIDPRTAWVMDGILRDAATSGTGARAHQQLKRNDVGGKTGTTNEAVDVWFGLHAHAGHHRLDGLRPAALAGHERIRQRPGPEHLAGLHAARAQGRARKQARAASGRPAGGQRRVLFQ